MTKTQLKKWLEGKMDEALREVSNQYSEAVSKYEEKRNTDIELDKTAKEIADLLSEADNKIESFLEKMGAIKGIEVHRGYYGSIKSRISSYCTTEQCRAGLLNEFSDRTKVRTSLSDKKSNMESEIKKNYINVIANVQNMKNAKAAVEYLQELGFDLSELIEADEHPVTTALSVPVDETYLFIGGAVNGTRCN